MWVAGRGIGAGVCHTGYLSGVVTKTMALAGIKEPSATESPRSSTFSPRSQRHRTVNVTLHNSAMVAHVHRLQLARTP